MIARLFKASIGWKLQSIILGIVLVMSTLCGYIYYYKTRDSRIYEQLLSNLSLVNSLPLQVSNAVGDIMLYQKNPNPDLEKKIVLNADTLTLHVRQILNRTEPEHDESRFTAQGLVEIIGNLRQISEETTEAINSQDKTIQLYENIELLNILTEVVPKNVSRYVSSELVYANELKKKITRTNSLLGWLLIFFILLNLLFVMLLMMMVRKTVIKPVRDLENGIKRFQSSGAYHRVEVLADDEIGNLTHAFNDMAEQLKASMTALQNHKEDLEAQVAARTADLEIANKGLESRTADLAIAMEQADAANAAKSNFLANMSHEIRTPINVIVGLTEVLIRSELTGSQRDYLNKVRLATKNLLDVINDILDFSKVEAGRMEIDAAPFDLTLVFEQMADLFSNRVAHKDLELIYSKAPKLPKRIVGDAVRLIQVLTNLIENAIKHTDSGEIIVSVQQAAPANHATGEFFLKFQVSDTGTGIAPDVLSTLFDPFTQADNSLTRRHQGTGLGLAICKRIVELMGGTIEAHSTPGKGSRFVFTVKSKIAEEDDAPVQLHMDLHGLKALVVDDSDAARQMLVDMLNSFKFEVTAVENGEKALEALQTADKKPYDLVLLDMKMPGMDGLETARRIKVMDEAHRGESHKAPIIIMVTAHGREQVEGQLSAAGLDAMLLKPVKPSDLLNTIMGQLKSPVGTKLQRFHDTPKIPPKCSFSGQRVLVVEDSDLNRDVALALLEDTGLAVELAENGKQAVEKVTLSGQKRFDAVLMDIQMPEMDGYEATRLIRAWEANHCEATHGAPADTAAASTMSDHQNKTRLPIIALTAHAMKGQKQRCLDADMDDFVAKPIDEQDLHRVLEKWIAT